MFYVSDTENFVNCFRDLNLRMCHYSKRSIESFRAVTRSAVDRFKARWIRRCFHLQRGTQVRTLPESTFFCKSLERADRLKNGLSTQIRVSTE